MIADVALLLLVLLGPAELALLVPPPHRQLRSRSRGRHAYRAGTDDRQDVPGHLRPAALTADNGWHGELSRDRHGAPVAIVAVHLGPDWTDAVAIEGEDGCVAMRHRTRDDRLIVPSDGSGVVWFRDGRC